MRAKNDRRVFRTRQALTAAFFEELAASGYDNLSVEAVAARANIGRSTFYLHYSGKAEILECSLTSHFSVLADAVLANASTNALNDIIAHFADNRKLAGEIFGGHARQVLMRLLAVLIAARLRSNWPTPDAIATYLPLELAATQIADAQLAMIEQWLRRHSACPPATIARALSATSLAMSEALHRCADEKAPDEANIYF
jgi:AcrR family transcriptional regulator